MNSYYLIYLIVLKYEKKYIKLILQLKIVQISKTTSIKLDIIYMIV